MKKSAKSIKEIIEGIEATKEYKAHIRDAKKPKK